MVASVQYALKTRPNREGPFLGNNGEEAGNPRFSHHLNEGTKRFGC